MLAAVNPKSAAATQARATPVRRRAIRSQARSCNNCRFGTSCWNTLCYHCCVILVVVRWSVLSGIAAMPKLAANLTMLCNEVDFLDRFQAAAKSEFAGVEYLFPYPNPKEQIAERLARHRLTQVLHNLPAGDWAKGDRGIACDPKRVSEFQDGVAKAIEYATTHGCQQLNCVAGRAPQGSHRQAPRATLHAN